MLLIARIAGGGLLLAALLCSARRGARGQTRLPVPARRAPAEPGGLSFALEVWAALQAAGEPLGAAIAQAASCCGSEVGRPLGEVSAGLLAGLPSAQAWAQALEGADSPTLVLAGQACVRSEHDGTPLAPVLRRLASEQRAAAASRGLVAARRAGVLAVIPLGLCTLPAYVLLSVAPAVIGLVRHVR